LRATRLQARNIEALNDALAGIPEARVRYHIDKIFVSKR
jgi:hypothetical protein